MCANQTRKELIMVQVVGRGARERKRGLEIIVSCEEEYCHSAGVCNVDIHTFLWFFSGCEK